jgi:thiol-disulfide isomerase/thioredoxin
VYFRDPYTVLIIAWTIITLTVVVRIVTRAALGNSKTPGRALGTTWIVLAVLVVGMTGWIYSKQGFGATDLGKAPDFSVTTLGSRTLTSQNLRGRVVLLEFWATWCAACIATMSSMHGLERKFSGRPFVLLGVSLDENPDLWRTFVAKNKMTWPQYLDRSHDLQTKFQVQGPPAYILIDGNGDIRFQQLGWVPTTPLQLSSEISKALRSTTLPAKR